MSEAHDDPGTDGDGGGNDADTDVDAENDGGNTGDGSGVQIDMISGERMDGLTSMEKIRLILDGVHEGNIVILEEGLDPDEESKLIEVTMTEISPDEFTGIEIETYPGTEQQQTGGFFDRLFGRESRTKLTVIGPANRLETLHKDETLISTLVTRR
ncbi:DUF2073 domain-containing protein [Halococcus salifodinae]|uniref:DUF2073 domain-containing protein n=2 Tax=Halococcus TaxID=2249 RepID=M0NC10_9EURY|nr:hypothetical protein C450_03512 [Halococcus salifodinae DSM 8989]